MKGVRAHMADVDVEVIVIVLCCGVVEGEGAEVWGKETYPAEV
jgi:hypothetical protein